jgi:hypothetical protein
MSKRIDPLYYHCMDCGANATFYDFFGEEAEAFRQYHYYDELCTV